MSVEQTGSVSGQSKVDQLPVFHPDALSSLTKNIKSNLQKQGNGSVLGSTPTKPKAKKEKTKAAKTASQFESPAPKTAAKVPKSKTPAAAKHKPIAPPKPVQGKKRLRDGRLKEPGIQKNTGSVNSIALGTRAPRSAEGIGFDIDEDMKAVGGTKDDIDLIADAHSESEIEGVEVDLVGGDIQKELQQLVRQLGVDHMGRRKQSEDTTSEEGYESHQQENGADVNGKTTTKQGSANGTHLGISATKLPGKGIASLAFRPQSEWHTVELPTIPSFTQETTDLPVELSDRIYEYAKSLLEDENKQYAGHDRSASSAHQFYSTIMSSGTLSDKISALTLSVQESPVHNMKALESLVGLARKRSRGQAVEVLGALKDLFGPGNLLPSDRKLRPFVGQPALSALFGPTDFHWTSKDPLPKPLKASHLISWAYEDWLKTTYFEVLKIIETWCNDEIVFARGKAVDYVCQLLKDKPEQEANLLRLLVNKLGDSDKKIASKTSFNILQLETTHPLMKPTIIAAIEADILFRPGQSLHAKYYATITLNQTVLSGREDSVARKLLDIYFGMFIKLLEKPEIAKAARGVNSITINRKGEVQGGGGPGGKKAQKKLTEKEKATIVGEDLREKMLSAVLTGVNRAIPFTNTNDESFEKHLNTLFKVTHSSNFNTSIQALMLIQQLNGSHQGSVDRFYRTLYESLLDPRLLTSSKQALYLNLLFRALRSDLNIKRVKAFAKRLLQVVAMHKPSFTCGTLYLLRELEGIFAHLEAFIDQPEEDDDEEENFKDVQEVTTHGHGQPKENAQTPSSVPSPEAQRSQRYDGRKRDPEYSNADHSSLWELTPFLDHYHPSVSLFANRLLTHSPMPPKPDLSLNTLIHFLDRFVYRNPKTTNVPKGASIMQSMAGGDSSALLVSAYSNKDRSRQPVNSEAFWKMECEKVNADEVFFHKYFSTLGRGKEKAQKRKADKKKDAEGSESGGEGHEDEIWKALVDSRPELDEGSDGGIFSDDDAGSEMEDLDSSVDGGALSDDGEEDGLDLADGDDDALVDSDKEVPSDLDEVFEAEVQVSKKKRPAALKEPEEEETRGKKRRRMKNLPTFASAEDYAKMLDEDEDEEMR